jgi:hypothetical protein
LAGCLLEMLLIGFGLKAIFEPFLHVRTINETNA